MALSKPNDNRKAAIGCTIMLAMILAVVGFWTAVGWVVIHFIIKAW